VIGDIELEIGPGSAVGSFTVRVIRSAAGGEPSRSFVLDVAELLSQRDLLEATILSSAVTHRSVPVAEEPVRRVGSQLFDAVFAGPVGGMYRASLGVAQQRGRRLRVVLRLTAAELASVPWEMLFDSETETYLCRREPLVRHVPAPYTENPLEVHLPLRVLGLVASPRDLPGLDVQAEIRNLAKALAEPVGKGLIELTWVEEATWPGVHARLLAEEWHVLHFIGHGHYDVRHDEGELALVGADGLADRVEASRLADLLAESQPMPRLVVLNSCSSGRSGVNDLFSGTASALVRSGISAVAAMQFAISDYAAIAFARGFYTAIAYGRSIDEAARSGRISILGTPRSLEWVTPVLYVRGEASHLFTLDKLPAVGSQATDLALDEPPAVPPAAVPAGQSQAQLRAQYVAARAELRVGRFDIAAAMFDELLAQDPAFLDAAELRDSARRGARLVDSYDRARRAEEDEDWVEAARAYGQALELDPAYRDAAARQEACLGRQKIADLQAELRYLADARRWQAVLDTSAELARLDPDSADPEGLADTARASLAAEQRAADLAQCYARAREDEDKGQWAAAMRKHEKILQLDPAYQDSAVRYETARQRQVAADLAQRYARAREEEDKSEWAAAAGEYEQILELDSAYEDAAIRLEACQGRQKITELRSRLRELTGARQWQEVLDVSGELARLDPGSADAGEFAETARTNLAGEQWEADLARARRARRRLWAIASTVPLGFVSLCVGAAIDQRSHVPHLGPGNWIAGAVSLAIILLAYPIWMVILMYILDEGRDHSFETTIEVVTLLAYPALILLGWLDGSHIGLAHVGLAARDWIAWRF
jgi:tetratricopeptide (TPR) repeat protein